MANSKLTKLVLLGVASGTLMSSDTSADSSMYNTPQSYSSSGTTTAIPSNSGMNNTPYRSSHPFDSSMSQQRGTQPINSQPYSTSQGTSSDMMMRQQQQNMMRQPNSNIQNMRPAQEAPLAMWGWGDNNSSSTTTTPSDRMQASDRMNTNNPNSSWQQPQDTRASSDRFYRDNTMPSSSSRMAPPLEESNQGPMAWEDSPRTGRPIPGGRILNRNTNWAPRVQNNGCKSPNGCGG